MLQRLRSTSFALAMLALAAGVAWAATATYKPPARTGEIYTVIDYKRTLGTTQNASLSVVWGTFKKNGTVIAPLGSCSQSTPAGFVLKLRHLKADSVLLTVTTNGTVIRGPYQGSAPAEWLHKCYKQVSW